MDVVRFDTYEVNLRAGELYKAGRKIKLQDQPFQILAVLLERAGQVVGREELQKKLWPADTFVDFDHSLNTAVKKLRQALSDDRKNPRYIETLPRRGYRFLGTVDRVAEHAVSTARDSEASSWVGQIGEVTTGSEGGFALVSMDGEAATEREKLDAAYDEIGLSQLISAGKLLLVANGTPVRILEVQERAARCQVRVLEGEHYGKTALVPLKWLALE